MPSMPMKPKQEGSLQFAKPFAAQVRMIDEFMQENGLGVVEGLGGDANNGDDVDHDVVDFHEWVWPILILKQTCLFCNI